MFGDNKRFAYHCSVLLLFSTLCRKGRRGVGGSKLFVKGKNKKRPRKVITASNCVFFIENWFSVLVLLSAGTWKKVRPGCVPRERVGSVIEATKSAFWCACSQAQQRLLVSAPRRFSCRRYPCRRKTRLRVSLKVLPLAKA